MGGCDQIDIFGVLLLELQEDLGESGRLDLRAVHSLRDRVILAVYAAHIAAGEENGAAPPAAGDHRLLVKIESSSRSVQFRIFLAIADFSFGPVHPAAPWAERAVCHIHYIV